MKTNYKKNRLIRPIIYCALAFGLSVPACEEFHDDEGPFSDEDLDGLETLEHAMVGGISEGDYTGVVRMGYYHPTYGDWHWFCTGVLVKNNRLITARHCVDGTQTHSDGHPAHNFYRDPSPLWIHMKGPSSPWKQVKSISVAASDRAVVYLKSRYPMYNRSTGQLSSYGYSRPWDWRDVDDMIGTWMVCGGRGGTGTTNPSSGHVAMDFFQVSRVWKHGAYPYEWYFYVPITGIFGGTLVSGDSGGPCLQYQAGLNVDQLPMSGTISYQTGTDMALIANATGG